MSDIHGDRSDVAEVVRYTRDLFRRRRREFLVACAVTFLVVHAAAFFLPGKFAATSAVLVQPPRSTPPLRSDPDQPPTVFSEGVSEEAVESEAALFTSREVLEATVDATGLALAPSPLYLRVLFAPIRAYEWLYAEYHDVPYPSRRERTIRGLGESLAVSRMTDSNVIVVTYTAGSPEVAEIVLGELLKHYREHHLRVYGQMASTPLIDSQIDVLSSEMADQEEALQELKLAGDLVDFEGEQEGQLEIDANLQEEEQLLLRRRSELQGMLERYDAVIGDATAGTDAERRPALSNPRLTELRGRLLELNVEQIGLESRYRDDFPLVVENRRKLEAAERVYAEELANVRDNSPTLVAADAERARIVAELGGIDRRLDVLRTQLAASRDRLRALDTLALEAARRERVLDATGDRYRVLLTMAERSRMEGVLDRGGVTNVVVIQEAAASSKPVSPRKTVVLGVSVLGALLVGVLVVLILELRTVGLEQALARAFPPPRSA